jgi:hypothetical protein
VQQLLQEYVGCFAFNLKYLEQLRGQKVHIILKYDNPIFKQPSLEEKHVFSTALCD